MNEKPNVEVVCAVIDRNGKILAVRRKTGEKMAGLWEFPGGKIKNNETPEQGLIREIKEELDISVTPEYPLPAIDYEYPEFHIRLIPFRCIWNTGKIRLKVHDRYQWLFPDDLTGLDWSQADIRIVDAITGYNR